MKILLLGPNGFIGRPLGAQLEIHNQVIRVNRETDLEKLFDLHEKYDYVAEYTQDRILVAHRVTSPLLFGIRTENNGFSSQSEEMKTAFSILQTMTIAPFQNLLLNSLDYALTCSGYTDTELYFEQLTPLVILTQAADDTGKTVGQVEDETNKSMENPATTDDGQDAVATEPLPTEKFSMLEVNNSQYEIYK